MTTRSELEASLAVHDAPALLLILEASGVDPRGAGTPSELAARIVDAIWWSYSTPLGYLADRASFEDVVWHVARKLRVDDRIDRTTDGYDQSQQLTRALFGDLPDEAIGVAQLDTESQRRLGGSWLPTALLGGGAGSSFVARWGTGKMLDLMRTPVGRLLPLLPAVGPYIGAVKSATSAVHLVAGPLGIGLSVLTFNQALGANYRRLVPLVLSVGALGPRSVDDAQIIDFPGTSRHDDTAEANASDVDDEALAEDENQSVDDGLRVVEANEVFDADEAAPVAVEPEVLEEEAPAEAEEPLSDEEADEA